MPTPAAADNEEQTQRIAQMRAALEELSQVCTTPQTATCTRATDIQFDGALFLQHIEKFGTVISHQVTKICLVCEHGNIPNDTPSIVNQLREGLDVLHAMRQNVPESAGATLVKAIDTGITDVIDGIYTWAIAVDQRLDPSSTSETQTSLNADIRSRAGLVWNACKALGNLPVDNTKAVLRQWRQSKSTVSDAIEEFESGLARDSVDSLTDAMGGLTFKEEYANVIPVDGEPVVLDDDMDELPKTEWERHICQCALASAKLIKQLLQKVEQRGIASTSPPPPPSWQDNCLMIVDELIENVDELGDLFWSSSSSDKARAYADAYERLNDLYTTANSLTELAREKFTESHRTWLDLCMKQLDKQRQSVKDQC